jgi:uncharacterized protein (DUF2062 family)
VVAPVVHQVTQGITPEKMALTLAVGSALGLFPVLGTTCALCLIAGVLLRLNQPAIQAVNGICWPIHLPVILALYHLGNWLFSVPAAQVKKHFFREMFWMLWDHPASFFAHFGSLVWHLVVAWALIAPFWVAIVYVVTLPVLREVAAMRLRECAACEERSASGKRNVAHPVP